MDKERAARIQAVVTGAGLSGAGLFALISLVSHQSADLLDYQAGQSGLGNWGGLLGALLSHYLTALYGLGAWVIALGLAGLGTMAIVRRSLQGLWLRSLGLLLLTALVAAWRGASGLGRGGLPEADLAGAYAVGHGGILGARYLAPWLLGYFGPVGIHLLLGFGIILSALMIAQGMTETVLATLGRNLINLFQALGQGLLNRFGLGGPSQESLMPAGATSGGGSVRMPAVSGGVSRQERSVAAEPLSVITGRFRASGRREKASFPSREKRVEPAGEAKKRSSTGKAPAVREAEAESKRRHAEAVRQAEAALKEKILREKEARDKVREAAAQAEKQEKERAALEKLERERAARERERAKLRAKIHQQTAGGDAPAAEKSEIEAKPSEAATPAPAQAPTAPPPEYNLPSFGLLEEKDLSSAVSDSLLKERAVKLIETLWTFNIGSSLVSITHGPAVTLYELSLNAGVNCHRLHGLADNLAMTMKSEYGVRILAPLPGRDTIGIEIPNSEEYVVRMRPILESPHYRGEKKWKLPIVLGRDSAGGPLLADLADMPHLLIAGTTGSGKSVCVNAIVLSLLLLRKPHEVKVVLVDPKQVELSDFKEVPHLLCPVVTDMKLAGSVLTWAVSKMEERYQRLAKVGVRNLATYNRLSREERLARLPQGEPPEPYADPMPYLVVIVDEFADLMLSCGREIEQAIARLAQKARAAGIHVILATQRPSADVVTGLIKANLPCRICFQVKSKVDSRIVLDQSGADKLAGKGDLLYMPPGSAQLIRAKGVYVADHEIKAIVDFCKGQAKPVFTDEIEKVALANAEQEAGENGGEPLALDEKFEEAVQCFLAAGRASTSLLQRRMGLGYTRAAKLCDQMERLGLLGPDRGAAKGRELLVSVEGWEAYKRNRLGNLAPGAKLPPAAGSELSGLELLDDVDGIREDPTEDGEIEVPAENAAAG